MRKHILIRCGVRWDLQQFTFDCCECGGYAMERKDCPICLGACNSVWERDVLAVSYTLLFVVEGRSNYDSKYLLS